jgi:hypothetical protein
MTRTDADGVNSKAYSEVSEGIGWKPWTNRMGLRIREMFVGSHGSSGTYRGAKGPHLTARSESGNDALSRFVEWEARERRMAHILELIASRGCECSDS